MSHKAIIPAIEKAMAFEDEGRDFFAQAAQRVLHPAVKNLSLMLCEEEKKHLAYLVKYLIAIRDEDKWPEVSTIDLETDFTSIYAEATAAIDKTVHVTSTEAEFLQLAADLEHKGRDMYLALAEKAVDENEKRLFAGLAGWESAHAIYIEGFISFFEDNGMYTGE